MKKTLLVCLLALAFAFPADAGNSLRGRQPPGGGGGPVPDFPTMCPDADCVAGDDVYYDAAADCWYCCDPVAVPGCGDETPCVATDCDPGDYLTWNDVGSCWECSAPVDGDPAPEMCPGEECVAGDVLTWNAVSECFECDSVGPGDVTPCDPLGCEGGDYLVWDDTAGCWACQTPSPDTGRRYLYRDQQDTVTPLHWWVTNPNADGTIFFKGSDVMLGYEGYLSGSSVRLYSASHSLFPGLAHLWSGGNNDAAADLSIIKWSQNAGSTLSISSYASVDTSAFTMLFWEDVLSLSVDGTNNRWFLLEDNDVGFGISTALTTASASCIDLDSGADRLYGDKDCDFTKDAGEEYLDIAGATIYYSNINVTAAQFQSVEAAYAPLDLITAGTNVDMHVRAFDPNSVEYINYMLMVPPDLASTGNLRVHIYSKGDGTIDALGLGVVWALDYVGRAETESYDAAYSTATASAETFITGDSTTLFLTTISVAVGSLTASDLLPVRIKRVATDGSDSYDGDAHLINVVFQFPQE